MFEKVDSLGNETAPGTPEHADLAGDSHDRTSSFGTIWKSNIPVIKDPFALSLRSRERPMVEDLNLSADQDLFLNLLLD